MRPLDQLSYIRRAKAIHLLSGLERQYVSHIQCVMSTAFIIQLSAKSTGVVQHDFLY